MVSTWLEGVLGGGKNVVAFQEESMEGEESFKAGVRGLGPEMMGSSRSTTSLTDTTCCIAALGKCVSEGLERI